MLNNFTDKFGSSVVPFEIVLPDKTRRLFGEGQPDFSVIVNNQSGVRALQSIDEGRIGDAYLEGNIDIDGDMLQLFALRASFHDFHPLLAAWRFTQPLLFGQVFTNTRAIEAHYDIDSEFFLSFLDPEVPCYTQGMYQQPQESLSAATKRKFDYCFEKLELEPGKHILEIGPGWGAWFEHASQRGVRCTGISNSKESIRYLERRRKQLGFDWTLINGDFLEFHSDEKYDAIVVMGVIEHLPNYRRVAENCVKVLTPGGRIFLDASACTKKYELSSFMVKYIYGGNHSFLVLHEFLEKLSKTSLRVQEIFNDQKSYFLTFQQWARNFESNRALIVEKFGEFNYRRFHLYLWGAAYEFLSGSLDCYRMIIR